MTPKGLEQLEERCIKHCKPPPTEAEEKFGVRRGNFTSFGWPGTDPPLPVEELYGKQLTTYGLKSNIA